MDFSLCGREEVQKLHSRTAEHRNAIRAESLLEVTHAHELQVLFLKSFKYVHGTKFAAAAMSVLYGLKVCYKELLQLLLPL